MNRYKIAIILLLIGIAGHAQSDLRKAGIYEVGDTTIEVYNWKEPFTIREFKIINGTDIILFREFNALTKKIKQEGRFKGGYSTGTWKFYGWTGRLKKEISYDNMVKTFYEKKNDLNAVDFNFEKYKEDSLFVYNYRKQQKETGVNAVVKVADVRKTESNKSAVDTTEGKKNKVLGGLFAKRKKEKNPTDSLDTKSDAVAVKDPAKQKKESSENTNAKTTELKQSESRKNTTDSVKNKQRAVAVKEPAKGGSMKAADPKKTELPKAQADAPKAEQKTVVAKEPAKQEKESKPDAPAKPAEPKKTESPKQIAASPKVEQKAAVAKEPAKQKNESKSEAPAKPAEPKKTESPKEIADVPKEKQHTEGAKEPVKSNKEKTTLVKGDGDSKNKQQVITEKKPSSENTAKPMDIKEVNATNSKANALLLEEYTKLKKESMPNVTENAVTNNKQEQQKEMIDSVKNKRTVPSPAPVKSDKQPSKNSNSQSGDIKQTELSKEVRSSQTKQKTDGDKTTVKSKENEAGAGTRPSNVKKNESVGKAVDSVKKGRDSLAGDKTIKTEKKMSGTNEQPANVKKITAIK